MKIIWREIVINLINCKDIVKDIKDDFKNQHINAKLCVIQVGDDIASNSYIKGKAKDCEYVGIDFEHIHILEGTDLYNTESIINIIKDKNNDINCKAIMVQLPLPKEFDTEKIISNIDISKDVDGFNLGAKAVSCTPLGIMMLINKLNIDLTGKNCVIINRSKIIGIPLLKLLLDKDATVTVCHSKTKDLKEITSKADIVFVAVGIPSFIKSDFIKDGAIVFDIGINRDDNGKLCGDVDVNDMLNRNIDLTPVPNGIGLFTRIALIQNIINLMKGGN